MNDQTIADKIASIYIKKLESAKSERRKYETLSYDWNKYNKEVGFYMDCIDEHAIACSEIGIKLNVKIED